MEEEKERASEENVGYVGSMDTRQRIARRKELGRESKDRMERLPAKEGDSKGLAG